MNQSFDLHQIQRQLGRFFARYHAIIFFLIIAVLLMVAILMILSIINITGKTDAANVKPIDSSFDEATIKRLNELQSGDTNSSLNLPNGRINPFSE